MLHRIDEALAARRIRALVLKGPLFAERFYPRPSARATSDIDLLVEEGSVPAAAEALEGLGYATATGPEEERFRREHHHLHLSHPHALPLELHFHAYRGFGHTLRSEPLIERSRMVSGHEFMTLRVADPADELVYLAVHASAHRFVRLAWLLDVRLLLERMTSDERELARARADAWGYRRALSLCALLVREVLGVSADSLGPIEPIRGLRESLLRAIVGEPGNPVLRSATRFVYTSALCDSWNASARYAVHASRGHAKRLLGFEV
ncbi:hypothetical protein AKJ09_07470 [Labilithrix luteola]|uniref:Nucleotidyltransferase family protein n=2 Tax=Labilithrix luteola TaxID=1391654 RepID=A0A0K1Q580_9BACT|nr:hypothetical protein AKJ09_07470 [Labilithrix luteola]